MKFNHLLFSSFLLAFVLLFAVIVPVKLTRSASASYNLSVNETIATGLDHPILVTHANDGSGRLFIVEQPGKIKIWQNGVVLPAPFLDIQSLVYYGGERGLLGLAFHPDYSTNGYFYVNYTRKPDGATVVARYQVDPNDPNQADPTSAFQIILISQPYSNHNGGNVIFGPDGYLYVGMGDGGSGGDPNNYAQNINSLLGKLLRLDVDHGSPYAIPPGNPYLNQNGADEIWALGLRNPWRFSFDRFTQDLYLADVGQNNWEELDFLPAGSPGGVNFGWRCREGTHTYNTSPPCDNSSFLATLINPFTEYSHSEGNSITGGFVYRGIKYPSMVGTYFFADFGNGKIWSIKKTSSQPVTWSARTLELSAGFNISSFGESEDGELYVVNYSAGKIQHLFDTNGAFDPQQAFQTSKKYPNTEWADENEIVTYTIQLSNQSTATLVSAQLTDNVPATLSYQPGSLTATSGIPDDSAAPSLGWSGNLTGSMTVTIQYRSQVLPGVTRSIYNTATLSLAGNPLLLLNSSLFTPRPVLTTTQADFVLPGTQPQTLSNPLLDSTGCDTCHSDAIYNMWRGSLMSNSARDPLVWAALAASNNYVPNSGELCLRCHVPHGWFAGRSSNHHGALLTTEDIHNGIGCQTCHRMVDPDPPQGSSDQASSIDAAIRQALTLPPPAGVVGAGMMVLDPQDRRRGPFDLGINFSYHPAYQTNFLAQDLDPQTEPRLCGTCHNVDNPVLSYNAQLNQYWPNTANQPLAENGFPIERTYTEWSLSEYAAGGVIAPQFAGSKVDKIVSSCQDCHLTRSTGIAAEVALNPADRDCASNGCLPKHNLLGANTWIPQLLKLSQWRLNAANESSYLDQNLNNTLSFLKKAATLEIRLEEISGQKKAIVKITNQTGHKLPTGYPEGRRMWLNLLTFDDQGNLLIEFGHYNPADDSITQDTKIYEVKQGLTSELATYLNLSAGQSFHFLLNNMVLKDNRIPPRGFTNAAFDQDGLRPVGAVYADGQYWDITEFDVPLNTSSVFVTLYYQVTTKDYVDFLKTNGGSDGDSLSQLWSLKPGLPTIVQQAWIPNYPFFMPVIQR